MTVDRFQSPINIDTKKASVLVMQKPLMWNDYEALPAAVTMENNGDTGE